MTTLPFPLALAPRDCDYRAATRPLSMDVWDIATMKMFLDRGYKIDTRGIQRASTRICMQLKFAMSIPLT